MPDPIPETSTRDRLLAAAMTLFTERGYAATSVREIVAAAGLAKPALYYHFGSKEGIYQALVAELTRLVDAGLAAHSSPAGGARRRVETLLLGLYGLFEQNQEALRFINAAFWGPAQGAPRFDIESFHARLANAVTGIVADGLRAGELRPVDPGDVTHALIGLFSFSMDLTLAHPDLGRGRAGLERALDLLFRGLAAPAARLTENPS